MAREDDVQRQGLNLVGLGVMAPPRIERGLTAYEQAINRVPYERRTYGPFADEELPAGGGVRLPQGFPGAPDTRVDSEAWQARFRPGGFQPGRGPFRPGFDPMNPQPSIDAPVPTQNNPAPPPKPTTRAIRLPNGGFLFTNRDEIGGEEVVGGPAAAGREMRAIERTLPFQGVDSDLVSASLDRGRLRGEDDNYVAPTRRVAGITPDTSGGALSTIEGTPQQQAEIQFRNTMDDLAVESARQELAATKMGEGGGFSYDDATGAYRYSTPAFPTRTRAIENELRLHGGRRAIDRAVEREKFQENLQYQMEAAQKLSALRSSPAYNAPTTTQEEREKAEQQLLAPYIARQAAYNQTYAKTGITLKDAGGVLAQ